VRDFDHYLVSKGRPVQKIDPTRPQESK
jgi:hypothetical protein